MIPAPRRACCGLLTERLRWSLSFRGWLLVLALIAATLLLLASTVHPFLAVTHRADARLLAVEGWIHDYAIRRAKQEFDAGRYQDVYATGGPVQGVGEYINDYSTAASIGAQRLKREGISAQHVHLAPARANARDRTYSAAVALRDLLSARHTPVRAINIVTEDVHARRTLLLFQRAFGPHVSVGVISVPNPDYDASHWWNYSQGVRAVLGETISYLYARFFFFPPAGKPADPSIHSTT